MSEDDEGTERLAYAGSRLDSKGKRFHSWAKVNDDNVPTGEDRNFSKQLHRAGVGAVFTVTTANGGTSVYTSGDKRPMFTGQYVDRETRIGWQAEHGAAEAQFKMTKAAAEFDNDMEEVLSIIQDKMRHMNKHQRAAMIGAVVARILPGGIWG